MKRVSVWMRLKRELEASEGREFERRILPLLRMKWPNLVQTSARGYWDRIGVDLLALDEDGTLSCIVQCKGFHVLPEELKGDQIRQVTKSLEDFIKSGRACKNYFLIYNRDKRNGEFHQSLETLVEEVVLHGSAKNAEVWDLETLLANAQALIKLRLDHALREYTKKLLDRYQGLLRFGKCYVSSTPVEESVLEFKRGEPCNVRLKSSKTTRNVSDLLLSPTKARWSLLTGAFGSGKTAAALHSTLSKNHTVVLGQCRRFPSSPELTSTNVLLESIAQSLDIFTDLPPGEQGLLYELAGPLLASLLRQENNPYVLIIDGLDEHRFYSHQKGLQFLSNQLAELKCPVILTTRAEHFYSLFGDFSIAFEEFSTKFGPKRNARLFKLHKWDKTQVRELIQCAISNSTPGEKEHLRELLSLMEKDTHETIYGDLLYNPLFLQFILEDVADQGVKEVTRPQLFRRWVARKIRRDRRITSRDSSFEHLDSEEIVTRILKLMEDISAHMVAQEEDTIQLTEDIDIEMVRKLAEIAFPKTKISLLDVLLNSILLPARIQGGRLLSVSFAFRVLQEFFLAAYLVHHHSDISKYPKQVRKLYEEIRRDPLE